MKSVLFLLYRMEDYPISKSWKFNKTLNSVQLQGHLHEICDKLFSPEESYLLCEFQNAAQHERFFILLKRCVSNALSHLVARAKI